MTQPAAHERRRAAHEHAWTEADDAMLRDCYGRGGLSASALAERIGVSRCAVIGRARRLGLHDKRIMRRHSAITTTPSVDAVTRAREPKPAPPPRAPSEPRPRSRPRLFRLPAPIPVTHRSDPSGTFAAIERVAARLPSSKRRRCCAWRPCEHDAPPGRMFCDAHEARAQELRSQP